MHYVIKITEISESHNKDINYIGKFYFPFIPTQNQSLMINNLFYEVKYIFYNVDDALFDVGVRDTEKYYKYYDSLKQDKK